MKILVVLFVTQYAEEIMELSLIKNICISKGNKNLLLSNDIRL